MVKKETRAQMQLSFGMIFSIILIIVFIFFAFYAIRAFLRVNDSAKAGDFVTSFQKDIDSMWKGAQGSQKVTYLLPSKVSEICFEDRGDKNLEFVDKDNKIIDGLPLVNIQHIDLNKLLPGNTKKFCFSAVNEKVSMLLEKKFGEDVVTLKKSD
ncbi:hypothetical protein HY212_01960 [Candidatus Pacearchaeota archaeon]|nr:hypothetical protein [Candidatus Pacearchaeota archaeon]